MRGRFVIRPRLGPGQIQNALDVRTVFVYRRFRDLFPFHSRPRSQPSHENRASFVIDAFYRRITSVGLP